MSFAWDTAIRSTISCDKDATWKKSFSHAQYGGISSAEFSYTAEKPSFLIESSRPDQRAKPSAHDHLILHRGRELRTVLGNIGHLVTIAECLFDLRKAFEHLLVQNIGLVV